MSKVVKIGIVAVAILLAGAGIYWWGALRDTSDPTASLDAMNASAGSALPASAGPDGATPDGTWTV